MNTILYLTDNTLSLDIAIRVQKELIKASCGKRIVSVSQKPIDFGDNICVGEIGKNWMSLYRQILAGIKVIETPTVAIAEHDCLYSKEHMDWIPPMDNVFYYNRNCFLVQWGGNHSDLDGMYSRYFNRDGSVRTAMSQLICNKDLLGAATEEILSILIDGLEVKKGMRWHGEFGSASDRFISNTKRKAADIASSGKSVHLHRYLRDYLPKYKSETFATFIPNLDIRHGSNFTGPKRGKMRTYWLPYWGDFKTLMLNEGGDI